MDDIKISALSFVFNEEGCIEKSLQALRPYVDEIIIVDLESTDGTKHIASNYADKLFSRPWQICGDENKMFLREQSSGDWLLWFYPDEVWPPFSAEALKKIVKTEGFDAFSFMRQEYMDGIRLMPHGTPQSPNYQNRLHRKCDKIFYTGLVHAELHGSFKACPMPPEYYFEHHKTSKAQEFDNVRLYIWYKYLVWKYGDTHVEPYRTYVASYRKIIADSEAKIATGERRKHPAEEEWWRWRDFEINPTGEIVDKAIKEQEECKK